MAISGANLLRFLSKSANCCTACTVTGGGIIVMAFIAFLVCQYSSHQYGFLQRHGGVQMIVQHFPRAGVAFAAASGHAQVAAQFGHAGQAKIDGLTDFTIRYVVADTYNH
eukprot:TRINITY_DN16535_c0_g1_i1.p2 TRINITY_DN16535_c0_g1~~TRINITY_DN16535_c0_g1_i1.p2  ORF type:complete len:110 (-),score=14.54 TRINITY_DN16535_c0_g1_i1:119-448(-)